MSIEEGLEKLTNEIAGLREDLAKLPTAGAAAEKKAPAKKAPAKKAAAKKAAEPEHDKDEVSAIIKKVATEIGKPKAREIITADGAEDLADLLTKPEQFDRAFADAEAALEEAGDEGEEEEDDGL